MNKKLLLSSIITLSLAGACAHAGTENDGNYNVLYGTGTGASLDGTGYYNTFIGHTAGGNTTSGGKNVFFGTRCRTQ